MPATFNLKRTTTGSDDFRLLINLLDNELWNELQEDQATYDQYNKVHDINTAVVVYAGEDPVACGCFKEHDAATIEIKRMYVKKEFRGKGLSRKVLQELEAWAKALGYKSAVLETSVHFAVAIGLYQSSGYDIIVNYPPYVGLTESVCMKKSL